MSCILSTPKEFNSLLVQLVLFQRRNSGYLRNIDNKEFDDRSLVDFVRSALDANIKAFRERYENRYPEEWSGVSTGEIAFYRALINESTEYKGDFQLLKSLQFLEYQCSDWGEFRKSRCSHDMIAICLAIAEKIIRDKHYQVLSSQKWSLAA